MNHGTFLRAVRYFDAGMVRPDQDRIGSKPDEIVEADETWIGGRMRGKGRGVHDMVLVACAVEVRQQQTHQ